VAITDAEVRRLRAETPGCQEVLHLNHAGMSLPPQRVLDAQIAHLQHEALRGGYRAAEEARPTMVRLRERLARLVGGEPDEIALVDSATRAWNAALHALPWVPGDTVLVGPSAYGSNMISLLQLARQRGVEVVALPATPDGHIDLEALEANLSPRVRLVALTHVATSSGTIQPAAAVGRIARAHDVPVLLDACQSAGQLPLDVSELGCAMLALTGRKYLRGPRGTGALWIRGDWCARLEPATLDARGATWTRADTYEIHPGAQRFELWESNVAGFVGLEAALELVEELDITAISDRIGQTARALRGALSDADGVRLHDRGPDLCGIVGFSVAGQAPATVKAALRAQGVNISVSEVKMTRLDLEPRGIESLLRASVHVTTTASEVDRFVSILGQLP